MNFLGVIPARWQSSRFPGKPLALIHGRPLIEWTLRGAQQSQHVSDWVVATDDDRIARAVEKLGVQAIMTDSELASGTDRIFSAYQNLNKKFDVVVNVQGDEPLITGAVIDQLVQPYLKSDSCVMSTLAHPLSAEEILSPHSVKVICNQYQEAIYFSRYAIPYSRKNAGAEQSLICYKHMGLYAYQVDFLQKFCEFGVCQLEEAESLEQLRALYMGVKIKVGFTSTGAQGVDTPEDVLKVERILKG